MRLSSRPLYALAVVSIALLSFVGCTNDYENDEATDENELGTTDTGATDTGQYPATGGTDPGITGGMDAGADDSAIKDQVNAQLRNDPRFEDVDIDVDDGIVTIDGQVQNQADLDQVQQLVRQVQGVRDVKLDIDIESEMNK